MQEPKVIEVLDKGRIELIDTFGTDLDVANDAKASFERFSIELGTREISLIRFLGIADPQHEAPFRGVGMKFRIKAPLMVARQWWKYVVASRHVDEQASWNEASRRYITDSVEFYNPAVWRSAPENRKQGSGKPLPDGIGLNLHVQLGQVQKDCAAIYERVLESGACTEQARLFLPAYGLYVSWHWLASLQTVAHFVNQRLEEGAQAEIREYAVAIDHFAKMKFPNAWGALRYSEKEALKARIKELEAELRELQLAGQDRQ